MHSRCPPTASIRRRRPTSNPMPTASKETTEPSCRWIVRPCRSPSATADRRSAAVAADSSVPTSSTTGTSSPVAGCSDDGRIVRVDVGGVQRPGELELDLLVLLAALVLDRELGADGDLEALTSDLDAERLVLLQSIGQPPQLGYQLGGGVDALDVTSTLCHAPSMAAGPSLRLTPGG